VVVRPGLKSGQKNDEAAPLVCVGLDLPAYLQAIHVRQHHVEQNQVRFFFPGQAQAVSPGGGFQYFVAGLFQQDRRETQQIGVIVYHQYASALGHHSLLCTTLDGEEA
jgi:hypothetical protein